MKHEEEVVLRKSTVNMVLRVAQACLDENRKGWRVPMRKFNDAMDDCGIPGKEVRAALEFLQVRMFVIAFLDEDGQVTSIRLVPQEYECRRCGMCLSIHDEREHYIDLCLRQQSESKRTAKLI